MYTFHLTTLEEVMREHDFTEVFESLRINEVSVEGICTYLENNKLMKIVSEGGVFCGFFSVEQCDWHEVEVHAYIIPGHRQKSKGILKSFAEAIFTLTPFTVIKTSVTSDHQHLVRFLKMMGFIDVEVQYNSVNKGGQTFNATTLKLYKGV